MFITFPNTLWEAFSNPAAPIVQGLEYAVVKWEWEWGGGKAVFLWACRALVTGPCDSNPGSGITLQQRRKACTQEYDFCLGFPRMVCFGEAEATCECEFWFFFFFFLVIQFYCSSKRPLSKQAGDWSPVTELAAVCIWLSIRVMSYISSLTARFCLVLELFWLIYDNFWPVLRLKSLLAGFIDVFRPC